MSAILAAIVQEVWDLAFLIGVFAALLGCVVASLAWKWRAWVLDRRDEEDRRKELRDRATKGAERARKYDIYWSKNRVKSKDSRAIASLVHDLVNKERRKRGRVSLLYDHHLAFIARGHSKDMAKHNYLGHVNRGGHDQTFRAKRKGYRFQGGRFTGLAENCYQLAAYGINRKGERYRKSLGRLAEDAVKGWMKSPGHRANMLNGRYRVEGIGFARSRRKDKVYLTQNFFG